VYLCISFIFIFKLDFSGFFISQSCCMAASLIVLPVSTQAIFGFGVGGEYPVASTSAAERAESSSTLVNRRGETVIMVFSMQVNSSSNFSRVSSLLRDCSCRVCDPSPIPNTCPRAIPFMPSEAGPRFAVVPNPLVITAPLLTTVPHLKLELYSLHEQQLRLAFGMKSCSPASPLPRLACPLVKYLRS